MFRLDGKAALVTGAGSGIGADIARLFAAQGATVLVTDVDEAGGRAVANELGPLHPFRRLDVADSEDARAAVRHAVDKFGRLDILVNNAGIGLVGSVEETEEYDFERLYRVNVAGVYHCCRHAVPVMLAQGGGCIINIGSVAGMVGIERRFAYSATKGAVLALTRQIAIDYVAKGIRCNAIAPGTVDSPFVDAYLRKFHAGEIEQTRAKLHARQPMGRMGRPEEIARLAVYLASDDSAFVTGAVFPIDGGLTAR